MKIWRRSYDVAPDPIADRRRELGYRRALRRPPPRRAPPRRVPEGRARTHAAVVGRRDRARPPHGRDGAGRRARQLAARAREAPRRHDAGAGRRAQPPDRRAARVRARRRRSSPTGRSGPAACGAATSTPTERSRPPTPSPTKPADHNPPGQAQIRRTGPRTCVVRVRGPEGRSRINYVTALALQGACGAGRELSTVTSKIIARVILTLGFLAARSPTARGPRSGRSSTRRRPAARRTRSSRRRPSQTMFAEADPRRRSSRCSAGRCNGPKLNAAIDRAVADPKFVAAFEDAIVSIHKRCALRRRPDRAGDPRHARGHDGDPRRALARIDPKIAKKARRCNRSKIPIGGKDLPHVGDAIGKVRRVGNTALAIAILLVGGALLLVARSQDVPARRTAHGVPRDRRRCSCSSCCRTRSLRCTRARST